MKQFILPFPPDKRGLIRLRERDYHYLARVRRLSPGDTFTALSPPGGLYQVTIQSIDGETLTGMCTPLSGPEGAPPLPRIILFQGMPKGVKMDLIVRQAAEGGISEIIPFASAFSVPRLGDDTVSRKIQRWERIIKEARQQSGSPESTIIKTPSDAAGIISYWETIKEQERHPLGILLHQDPLEQGTFHGYLSKDVSAVALLIGPEGGFSPEETALFMKAGFKPLVIGNTILRTETAALYAAAAIRVILLEKASWTPRQPLLLNGSDY